MKGFLVLREDKKSGFFTTDAQLAYEVRKGADSNCFTQDGEVDIVARAFCEQTQDENCTIVEILEVD